MRYRHRRPVQENVCVEEGTVNRMENLMVKRV